jgi:hypothetical protein
MQTLLVVLGFTSLATAVLVGERYGGGNAGGVVILTSVTPPETHSTSVWSSPSFMAAVMQVAFAMT